RTARTSRATTVPSAFAPRPSPVDQIDALDRRFQISADLGNRGEAIVGRLRRVGGNAFAKGSLPATPATTTATAAHDLALLGQPGAFAAALAGFRNVVLFGERFSLLLHAFFKKRRLVDSRREVVLLERRRLGGALDAGRDVPALDRVVIRARQRIVRFNCDRDAEPPLEVAQVGALLIEDIERDGGARANDDVVRRTLDQRVLKRSQHVEGDRRSRAHDASALAVRADDSRTLEDASANALTRHFEQAEM